MIKLGVVLSLCVLACATPSPTLIGPTSSTTETNYFSQLNPLTGDVVKQGKFDRWQCDGGAYLGKGSPYVAACSCGGHTVGLLSVDVDDGIATNCAGLGGVFSFAFPTNLVGNPKDKKVYGWSVNTPSAGGGLYAFDPATGDTTLVAAATADWDVYAQVGALEVQLQKYVFFATPSGGSEGCKLRDKASRGSNDVMIVVDIAAGTMTHYPMSVPEFIVPDPYRPGNMFAYNFTGHTFVTVSVAFGHVTVVAQNSLGGIAGADTAVSDPVSGFVHVVVVDPKPNPSRYVVKTVNANSGRVINGVHVAGNYDFAYLALL